MDNKVYKTSFNLTSETKENLVKIQGIIQAQGQIITKSQIVDYAISAYLNKIRNDKIVL